MTEQEFEQVFNMSIFIQARGLPAGQSTVAEEALLGFEKNGAIKKASVIQAAYVINVLCMDMAGNYDKIVLEKIKELYIKNVELLDDEIVTLEEDKDITVEKSMSLFLDDISSNEYFFEQFIQILLTEDDYAFTNLRQEVVDANFSLNQLLTWLDEKKYASTITEKECVITIEKVIDELRKVEREEDAMKLLEGDQATYDRIRAESRLLSEREDTTYDWFYENYIEGHYGLRYLLKSLGISFPESELIDIEDQSMNRENVEDILIRVQIEHIQREIEEIKQYYYGRYIDSEGREYDIDHEYDRIICHYEPLLEETITPEDSLNIYKEMYQECLDLMYDEIESQEIPLLYEKCLCGTDATLVIYESDLEKESEIDDDEELPF